ncbi:uncharacterized protein J3D65DRAFT_371917 [Phyllosticta citribraziliensis]|uniref:Uncharacterized protein n=1 Tax=Phyllosticta citribraziliensis TaxID=989973 RepID=A0ABR1LPY8_9PEZI
MAEVEDNAASEGSVDPAQAQGAQIPLQTFALPVFPPEAQGLKALTLTSDVKLDEYTKELESFQPIPALPPGIESLTLELFSLGYPAGFLSALADALPHLKSFDAYSQLLCGITKEAQEDALVFFDKLKELKAIHLLDVFARPGFFEAVGNKLAARAREQQLMFLQFNYTFRHEDEDFLRRIPAAEPPTFINKNLVMCSFNIAAPDTTDDPEDPTNVSDDTGDEFKAKVEGVAAFHKSSARALVDALTGANAPDGLRALNTTLYTFTLDDLEAVLRRHRELLMISATVEVEPNEACKRRLLDAFAVCPELERVEIVGNPTLEFSMAVLNPRRQTLRSTFPSAADMRALEHSCPRLSHFSANILRTLSTGQVEWNKAPDDEEGWTGGVSVPEPARQHDDDDDVPQALRQHYEEAPPAGAV